MIQTIQTADVEGGFDWIEIPQRNPLVASTDPNDPNDPMSIEVCRQTVGCADRMSASCAVPRGIDRISWDQSDRLDQQAKSMACKGWATGSRVDRLDHPHGGRVRVLPRWRPSRGARSPDISACEEILESGILK